METKSSFTDIDGARALVKVGDSITTDHISPAGSIKADSPAGLYLQEHGIDTRAFYGELDRAGLRWRSSEHHVREEGLPITVRLAEITHG